MIVGWKAFYADAEHTAITTYSSGDTRFENLPQDGCLGIVLFESSLRPDGKNTRTLHAGYDYYFKSGEVYGVDVEVRNRDVPEEIVKRYRSPYVIRGIWTTHDLFNEAQAAMRDSCL